MIHGEINQRELLWKKAASRLRRRVNLGWWYQELVWPLIGLGLVTGAIAMAGRRYEWELGMVFWISPGVLVVFAGVFAGWRAKRHWLSASQALVRLEADLGLNNALSTAEAGHGSWPEHQDKERVVRWRAEQVALPMLAVLAFLLVGFGVPILPVKKIEVENQPYTWSRLESELAELVAEEIIDEDYAEEMQKRLDELLEQKAEEWFSAASLEATDSLRQAHSREMNRLQRDLMQVEQALRKSGDPNSTEAERQKLKQQFEEAMEGLRNGQMKPNENLMKKLAEAAKQGMKGMSDAEQKALQERLRKMAGELGKKNGNDPGQNGNGNGSGKGEGESPGEGKQGSGPGEPDRGPGAGGDLFGADSPELDLEKFEHLEGKEDQEPEPGDLLNLEETEHDKETGRKDPTTSGSAKSEGLGGDRVWKDALDPDEQKSLKSFFE